MNAKGSSRNNQGLQLKTKALCNILLIYYIDLTVTVLHISFFGFRWSHRMPVILCCLYVTLYFIFIIPGPTFIPTLQKYLETYNFIVSVQLILNKYVNTYSVQFSHSVVYNSANPWTTAHQAFLSITKSWSLLRLMSIELVMPSISPSVVPFSSGLQSFPASRSFLMSQFFASGGQSIGVSASASVLLMNIQD